MSRDNDQKGKEPPDIETSRDNGQKHVQINNILQLQNHFLTSIHKTKSLFSATSFLSCSPIVSNTTTSSDKEICGDSVDCGRWKDRFGRFLSSEKDSIVKMKISKKGDNKSVPNGAKSYNGRGTFQPICAIEQSADHCSRKLF